MSNKKFHSRIENFIQTNNLIVKSTDSVLIAFSGGVDSVVLADILENLGYNLALAHVNFQLRKAEADEDEKWCAQYAAERQLPYYSTTFNTASIVKKSDKSKQHLARDLRYEWLLKLAETKNFTVISTAHHLDDLIENALMRMSKGGGLRSISSIPIRRGNIVRPLMFATKEEILLYAKSNDLEWRIDSSNEDRFYLRNAFRHEVIPAIETIVPSFKSSFLRTLENLREAANIVSFSIDELEKEAVSQASNNLILVDMLKVKVFASPLTVLHHWLSPLGFNRPQIINMLTASSGSRFTSAEYEALINRNQLEIRQTDERTISAKIKIDKSDPGIRLNWLESTISFNVKKGNVFSKVPNVYSLDLDCLNMPLTLRGWNHGDWFCPLGMRGKKQKLQDFFVNNKLSIFRKEITPILIDNAENICCVIGNRIDERFKVSEQTNYILEITID